MGSLFRSEPMCLIQLFIQSETAHDTVSELGELGLIQFRDLNPDVNAFQRNFVREVRRCDEMERKLRFLHSQLEKAKVAPVKDLTIRARSPPKSLHEIDALDEKLTAYEEELKQMNKNEESLNLNFLELTELKQVLDKVDAIFAITDRSAMVAQPTSGRDEASPLLPAGGAASAFAAPDDDTEAGLGRSQALGYLTGVIPRTKFPVFERVLWRALRGNLYMRHMEIEDAIDDPETGEPVQKDVFVIFSHGEQLQGKIRKIADRRFLGMSAHVNASSFGATLYPAPETQKARRDLAEQVMQRMVDMQAVLNKTQGYRRTQLTNIAADIESWVMTVRKEKAIFHTMNMFSLDITAKCLVAEGWCPVADMDTIQTALLRNSDTLVPTVLHRVDTSEIPPTFNRTNKFTEGFQIIIDAYGVGTYREVNPTPFAIITFPFLFAVMFGDLGHGFLVTIVAALMIIYEKKLLRFAGDEIFDMVFGGRFIILLMGIFSMYTGLIYNDIFSKAMEIFHSGWEFELTSNTTQVGVFTGHIYPVGLDPGWHSTDNLLIFTNSYKMKMSVLFGVLQMSTGIVLSCYNHYYFRRYVSVFNEFLPQMIFLQSIFGYLSVAIIFKWCTDWTGRSAPSLLDMLINMFVSPFKVLPADEVLYANQTYLMVVDSGPHHCYGGFRGLQTNVQIVLLVLALICVPWMLLVKPLWLRHQHNKMKKEGFSPLEQSHSADDNTDPGADAKEGHDIHDGHGEFEFGEVMVHQIIHTIEFCLGAVSNTASYLRLWALSLAHAQLSLVLWDMTLNNFFISSGFTAMLGLVGGFAAWFTLTIGILVVMEGLSAFLHALRLHWVEFNNKFYEGGGYPFRPFSLAKAAAGSTE